MCLVKALLVFLSLVPGYQSIGDDRDNMDLLLHHRGRGQISISEEQQLFMYSGMCAASNRSRVEVCDGGLSGEVRTLRQLKHTNCRCDDQCLDYDDCCIDKLLNSRQKVAGDSPGWRCREARGVKVNRVPFYVYQQCPASWEDEFFRDMCEIEAVDREKMGLVFDHLQDIPVISETTRRFYRNVYCAVCNGDVQLYRWNAYTYCNGDSATPPYHSMDEDLNFSEAVYVPRTMNYRKVRVGTKFKNCQIIVRNFELSRLVPQYGARMCKPIIDSCPDDADLETRHKCKKYSSYVYNLATTPKREIYRNFHCAICNGIPIDNISCLDPFSHLVYTDPAGGGGRSSLSLLFDFNFRGGQESVGSRNLCLMHEGQVWDPIFKRCQNFTCGALYRRDGFQCRPLNDTGKLTGIKNSCLKIILESDQFLLLSNGSVYINKTKKILTSDEFEVHAIENKIITKIAVCLDSNPHLLPYSKAHSWLSIITLSISITCLILHLVVYSLLEKMRNTPGKVLMSLSASLLCGHIFLLLGPHFTTTLWMCYINGVATHFGYLSAFSWMSVMAYDIHATFSVTQSHNKRKQQAFVRYSLYAWMSSLLVIISSVTIDNLVPRSSDFRPKYGDPICWFNNKKGLLIFFVVPATVLLFANIALFSVTAFHIRKVSRQTKMVNNFSDKVRYFLYLKLAVVLGLTWILGLLAGITQMDAFWYPFIVLNGLQGSLIFIAFTIKRSIFHMLAVKLKFRSSKYRIGKQSGIKAAMYSSLSNLTLQTTTTSSQIPSLTENRDMLKAVRRINPDASIVNCKL